MQRHCADRLTLNIKYWHFTPIVWLHSPTKNNNLAIIYGRGVGETELTLKTYLDSLPLNSFSFDKTSSIYAFNTVCFFSEAIKSIQDSGKNAGRNFDSGGSHLRTFGPLIKSDIVEISWTICPPRTNDKNKLVVEICKSMILLHSWGSSQHALCHFPTIFPPVCVLEPLWTIFSLGKPPCAIVRK